MTTEPLSRPTSDNHSEWKAYWKSQGEPWRTELEISFERQRELTERRDLIHPDIERGIYPFKDIELSRADIEWLLHSHNQNLGPITWKGEDEWRSDGLDLRSANLAGLNLSRLPLTRILGGLKWEEYRKWRILDPKVCELAAIHFEDCNLFEAHLEGANLRGAHLEGADLHNAHMQFARLFEAHCEGANLRQARLEGAIMHFCHFESRITADGLTMTTNLRQAFFNSSTILMGVTLGTTGATSAALVDIHYDGVNIAIIPWKEITMLGDEWQAHLTRKKMSSSDRKPMLELPDDQVGLQNSFNEAVRAYRQVATTLRAQGVNEIADRFSYRAQLCQRRLYRKEGWQGIPAYLGSNILDLISGYGYRPLRSLATYAFVILAFSAVYFFLGQQSHPTNIQEAIVVSMTAFHGRGFFATSFSPGDPQAIAAAVEAFVGLFIEITFIATFTQRFFSR